MSDGLLHEKLTRSVIGAFFEVYNELGFGFLELNCIKALDRELRWRGHKVSRELGVFVMYKGEELGTHRLDMVVDDTLIIEVKSTLVLHASAKRQLTNYLRATDLEIGLLLHFGEEPNFYRRVFLNKNKPGFLRSSAPDPRDPGPTDVGAAETQPTSEGV